MQIKFSEIHTEKHIKNDSPLRYIIIRRVLHHDDPKTNASCCIKYDRINDYSVGTDIIRPLKQSM